VGVIVAVRAVVSTTRLGRFRQGPSAGRGGARVVLLRLGGLGRGGGRGGGGGLGCEGGSCLLRCLGRGCGRGWKGGVLVLGDGGFLRMGMGRMGGLGGGRGV
jgi:hypothetical protein